MVLSIFTIGVLAACGDTDDAADNNNNENNVENNSEENENNAENDSDENVDLDMSEGLPEADLDGIPDIVAEINGEEITGDEFASMYEQQFQQQAMQAQMSGQDMGDVDQDQLKEQMVENMVGQKLLVAEANNRITDVSEDDINETVDQVVAQNGMESKEDLLAAFEEQGMDEKEFMSEVETQVKVDQLIEEISEDTEPTEEETKEAYEMIKSQQEEAGSEEDFPEFDDIKSDLAEQLKEQKKSEEAGSFIETLREKADVTIHL